MLRVGNAFQVDTCEDIVGTTCAVTNHVAVVQADIVEQNFMLRVKTDHLDEVAYVDYIV